MKDGTVFLVKYRPKEKWVYSIVGKVITFITKSPYTHTGIYINGKYFDDTIYIDKKGIHSGVRVSEERHFADDAILEYVGEFSPDQVKLMEAFLMFYSKRHIPYGIGRLISLAIVYPTRWFWKMIGYVPFEKSAREVCSTIVADTYEFAGINLFPDMSPEMIAPGDFLTTKLLKQAK